MSEKEISKYKIINVNLPSPEEWKKIIANINKKFELKYGRVREVAK